MAVVDDKTPFLQLPLPHAQNNSNEDVERLRNAYLMLDAFAEALSVAVAGKAAQQHQHEMDTIFGLLDALAGKAAKDHTHSLASLTDTDLSEVANGKFFKFVGTKWIPATILAGDVPSFEAAINARLALTGGTLTGDLSFDATQQQRTFGFDLPNGGGYYIFARPSDGRLGIWDNKAERIVFEYDPATGEGAGSLATAAASMRIAGQLVMHFGMKATGVEYRRGTGDKILTADNVWEAAGYVGLSGAGGSTLAAGTYAPNFGAGLNFYNFLGGNITIGNPTNTKPGQTGLIVLQQDTTGGRTVAFGSAWRFANGNAPSMDTGASRTNVVAYQVLHSGFVIGSSIAGLV